MTNRPITAATNAQLLASFREGRTLASLEWEGFLIVMAEGNSPEWRCGELYAPAEMNDAARTLPNEGWPYTGDVTIRGLYSGRYHLGWDYNHTFNDRPGLSRLPSTEMVFRAALPMAAVIRDRHHTALAMKRALAEPEHLFSMLHALAPYPMDPAIRAQVGG